MSDRKPSGDYDVGYAKAPASNRFRKGQSGNPRGRPRNRHNEPPYEAVLGQKVTIREDGVKRTVTAAEAFLLHMAKRGLDGDGAAARSAMAAIDEARSQGMASAEPERMVFVTVLVSPGSVSTALKPLRMAVRLDRHRETARVALEPWLVEAALSRLTKRLTVEQQKAVARATRTPSKVQWPDWWEVRT